MDCTAPLRTSRRLQPLVPVLALSLLGAMSQGQDDITFAVLGHLRGNQHGETYFLIDELVADVRALDPDAVVLTGDLIWGEYHDSPVDRARVVSDWELLDRALVPLEAPVYRVPGNHDINDPVTRDVYLERYGPVPTAVDLHGFRFLLLCSPRVPEGDAPPPVPRRDIRITELAPEQIEFLRRELADPAARPAFVFLHHVVWWDAEARWWTDVHPLLVQGNVRAVFAGDYGPMKFSHTRQDGIDYFQSSVEGRVRTDLLRIREESRLLHYMLDNYLVVRVRGGETTVEVRTVGTQSSGKFSPELYHEVFAPGGSPEEFVLRALRGPRWRTALALLLAAAFGGGVLAGGLLFRRRRAASAHSPKAPGKPGVSTDID